MARVEKFLADQVARAPLSTALSDSTGVRWTFADLDAASDALAAELQDAGVQTDDRVLLLAENCAAAVSALALKVENFIAFSGLDQKAGTSPQRAITASERPSSRRMIGAIWVGAIFQRGSRLSPPCCRLKVCCRIHHSSLPRA